MDSPKKISIVSSAYNEESNLQVFYDRIVGVMAQLPKYSYEIIIADNCSTDGSRSILRRLASQDSNVKIIFNAANVGPTRSACNAMLKALGHAIVPISSDLQDPPEIIPEFIRKWEEGNKVVVAVKTSSEEKSAMFAMRRLYYRMLTKLSEGDPIIENFTGFGCYDRKFVDALRALKAPNPYFRGLVSEIGFQRAEVKYVQPTRQRGHSKSNFFFLYDTAMSGFVNHSKLPLRLATFCGFCLAGLSFMVALVYLVYKLLCWDTFTLGLAPVVIGLFFFSAVQLIFIGIVGEYVGAILTQVKDRPWAIEDETINFEPSKKPEREDGSAGATVEPQVGAGAGS